MLGRVLDRVRVFGVGDLPVELRGWSREVGEVDFEYLPTVSEAFSPCPTHRDVYVRRVLGLQPRVNESLSIGRALHELFLAPLRLVNRVSAGDVIEELSSLKTQLLSDLPRDLVGFGKVVFEASSRILMDLVYDGYPIPVAVEPSLEGTVIGFSDVIRPDLVIGSVPVEVVVSDNPDYLARKELALAVYGMAVEAHLSNPVNYGVLVVINPRVQTMQFRHVVLSDSLRREAIKERNEVARIVSRRDDPGPAPKCPDSCPLKDVCRGVGNVEVNSV